MESVGGKAAPEWNDHLLTSGATNVVFFVHPVGWVGDWHPNPKPQWIVDAVGPLVRGDDGRHAGGDGAPASLALAATRTPSRMRKAGSVTARARVGNEPSCFDGRSNSKPTNGLASSPCCFK